jgi:hypothetical protein
MGKSLVHFDTGLSCGTIKMPWLAGYGDVWKPLSCPDQLEDKTPLLARCNSESKHFSARYFH